MCHANHIWKIKVILFKGLNLRWCNNEVSTFNGGRNQYVKNFVGQNLRIFIWGADRRFALSLKDKFE